MESGGNPPTWDFTRMLPGRVAEYSPRGAEKGGLVASNRFRRGSVFRPNTASPFSPRGGQSYRRLGQVSEGQPRGRRPPRELWCVWEPAGRAGPRGTGGRAGLLAPASRGTATPTGRAGTAAGPSRRPRAGGAPAAWRGWGGRRHLSPGSARPSRPRLAREGHSLCF